MAISSVQDLHHEISLHAPLRQPPLRLHWLLLVVAAPSLAACEPSWLVINEVQLDGPEPWVEIANTSHHDLDLTGYGICVADTSGQCSVDPAARFPPGTQLGSGKYLVVMTNQVAQEKVGPHATCTKGVQLCFYSPIVTAVTSGQTILLLDPQGGEASRMTYPANTTVDLAVSWAILPDLFGEAQAAFPTPGDPNHQR